MERGHLETASTTGQEIESLATGEVSTTLREVGSPMIPLWPSYLTASDALVFVVDLSQPEQVAASSVELNRLIRHEGMKGTPCLVLLNKIDALRRLTVAETADLMGLCEVALAAEERGTKLECIACSGVTGAGCGDVVERLKAWAAAKPSQSG